MNLKNPKPRHVKIDPKNPSPIGICDDSDFVFNKEDLVPQREWRGDRLVPTGFLRGRPFLDEPNEQLRTPIIKADPYPVENPRPPQPSADYFPQELPAPSNDVIKAKIENMRFTYGEPFQETPLYPLNPINPNPDLNPDAPKGAPDGIPVPKEIKTNPLPQEIILSQLLKVNFNQ